MALDLHTGVLPLRIISTDVDALLRVSRAAVVVNVGVSQTAKQVAHGLLEFRPFECFKWKVGLDRSAGWTRRHARASVACVTA